MKHGPRHPWYHAELADKINAAQKAIAERLGESDSDTQRSTLRLVKL